MDFETEIMDAIDNLVRIRGNIHNYNEKYYEHLNNAIIELRHALGQFRMPKGFVQSSRTIKSDFDENGNWVEDEKPVKKEDMHGSFRKLTDEEKNELRPQVEDELGRWMSKKHFGLDKDVYDETVEYIISLFGEDNYAPKDVKEAVSSWYNDTLDSFPEMLQGKGEKRKVASSAYLKQIKSSHCIKSSKKPIKSSTYQFVCTFDGQYQPRAIVHIDHQGLPIWEDTDEGYSNAKSFSEAELPNAVKNITEYNDYNDIEIVKDNGDSVTIPEFLKAGSFDAAWAKAIEDDDKWSED